MIASFGDKGTADVYHAVNSREARQQLPRDLLRVAQRKLDMIHAATKLDDLKAPPANRLEQLKGELAGWFSIRINDQYRIVFRWVDGEAHEVTVRDYH